MGKVVKTVLKVAAVAAISFFAPPLASAALASLPVASTLGATGAALAQTAVSGVIGAGLGELTGVGWKAGLMAGGLGGAGSSGLFGGPAGPGGAMTPATNAPSPGLGGSLPAAGAAPAGVAPATGITISPAADAAANAAFAAARAVPGLAAVPQTLGQVLSGAIARPTSVVTGGLSNLQQGITGGVNALGRAVGLGPPAAAGAAPAGAAPAGAAPATGAAASQTLGQTVLSSVGPSLLAAGLTTTPGAAITGAQQAELQRAQEMNEALTRRRLDQANRLFNEAEYYDPEYMARQAAESALTRGGLREVEGTRGLTGERLAAERRRFRLGTARAAGSAYQQGYGTGVNARTEVRRAGIQAMPTGFPTTAGESATALQSMLLSNEERRKQEEGIAKLFGQVLNRPRVTAPLA